MAPDQDIDLPFALRSGDVVGGYTIVRVIGYGGFGITYRAHNRVTLKQVAIKEFFPVGLVHRDGNSRLIYSQVEADTITWALNKFETTTTTLCGLTHPNIVQVYDYLSTNATGYMIMELLEGQTLADWLKNRAARPSLPEVRPVVEPVMDALCYLHENGLIHRDIAPEQHLRHEHGSAGVDRFRLGQPPGQCRPASGPRHARRRQGGLYRARAGSRRGPADARRRRLLDGRRALHGSHRRPSRRRVRAQGRAVSQGGRTLTSPWRTAARTAAPTKQPG